MCRFLSDLEEGPRIVGIDLPGSAAWECGSLHAVDLCDADTVSQVLHSVKPDYVIHLAGTFGTENYHELLRVNVLSLVSLLEAVRRHVPHATVVTTGSAAEYGSASSNRLPLTEQTECLPITPYGLSKQLASEIALFYWRVHNLSVAIVRPFQLIGSGVTTRLAPGAFAEQIKRAVADGTRTIKVGNLGSYRDFLDIHDAVEAIWSLCLNPAPGEIFNLCSGSPTRIADLLSLMIEQCDSNINVEIDQSRVRGRTEISCIYGSSQKLRSHCGWMPKRKLEDSVAEMFQ